MQNFVGIKYLKNKNASFLLLAVFLVFFIVSCTRSPYVATTTRHAGGGAISGGIVGTVSSIGAGPLAIAGGVVGGVVGYDLQKKESLILQKIEKLNSYGVSSEFYGQQVKFILGADICFYNRSNALKGTITKPMLLLAEIINYFPVTTIEIVGFVRGTKENDILQDNKTLEYTRAQTVMKYLQKLGVNPNLIVAHAIQNNPVLFKNNIEDTNFLYSDSDRIEITLNPISYYE